MKRKRTVAIVAFFAVALIVTLTALTLGFLGDSVFIDNKFIIGRNKSKVEEETDNYSQTNGTKNYKKEVTVKNEDNVPCYVRVFMDFSNSDAEAKSKFSNKSAEENPEATDFYTNSDYKTELAKATNTVAEKWMYVPDTDATLGGYYYYKIPIDPGTSTDTLIKQVQVNNQSEIKDFNILVYSETVRADDPAPDWSKLTDAQKTEWANKAKAAWTSFLTTPTSP